MATLADSMVSSSSRPLALRMRPDLSARQQKYHGKSYWVVKEPVGLNYYRFHDEEYAILCMLDGMSSMESIKNRFEEEFPPQKITFGDLQQFIGMLHRSGLVISYASGQGKQLKKRRDEKKRKELLGKFTNVFAIRFRGIDPEKLLNRLYPYTGWFFRWYTVVAVMLFALSALLLLGVQFNHFVSKLPTFHQFFGPRNWLSLAVVMGLVKVLHEFGHGLSCKHFRGECHEMGFMMLVFTPALYCNVSDSWMLPSKWHRAAIGAAGIYVELTIAAIATYVWWYTDDGTWLSNTCLSVMFICSVSTILFNGNPLLRFDGYYITMDLLEIPNLRQKSTEVLKRFLSQLCLGIEQPENPFLPQRRRWLFGFYTVVAVMYRWVVVFGILMFLNSVLEPYGLKIIGRLIGMIGFFGLIVQPLIQLGKFFYTPGRMHRVKKHRLFATLGVIALLILAIIYVPFPYHVAAPFTIEAQSGIWDDDGVHTAKNSMNYTVFADANGWLKSVHAKSGDVVTQQHLANPDKHFDEGGSILIVLSNVDLKVQNESIKGEIKIEEANLDFLKAERSVDRTVSGRIRLTQRKIEALKEQLKASDEEMDRLKIRAKHTGTIILPKAKPTEKSEGVLPDWSGYLLSKKNKGCAVRETDVICQIGDPNKIEAVLVIDQSQIEMVKEGHEVDMMLEENAGRVYTGKVRRLALDNMARSPERLASQAGGQLGTVADGQSIKPINPSYQAIVELDEIDQIRTIGLRGQAKIYTGYQPLGTQLYRLAAKTFHFDL